MTNYGKLFSDELTGYFINESGFKQYQLLMYIKYKYAPYGTKSVVLYYVNYYVYWCTCEALGKWFLYNLGKRFHVNFMGFSHWFIYISIFQLRCHSVSLYQDRYATYIVDRYLDTDTVKKGKKNYNNTLPSDMIFAKDYVSTSDEKV